MKVVTDYPDGVFCWVDLASTNPEAVKAFYSGLFGWDVVDIPIDSEMGGVYTMFKIDGHNVAGLGTTQEGMPSFWSSYVKHSDVDAIAEKAAAAGGSVMFPPMDVMEEGRMAMIQGPDGAVVGVWQPINHIGAQIVNQPNSLVWNELQTQEPDKAQAFYSQVFGWEGDDNGSGYVTYMQDGRRHAGMMQIDDSMGVPNNWATYFMVEDVEAAAEKAKELGGQVVMGPMPAGEIGTFAVILDPAGAAFSVIHFNGPPDPPPGY